MAKEKFTGWRRIKKYKELVLIVDGIDIVVIKDKGASSFHAQVDQRYHVGFIGNTGRIDWIGAKPLISQAKRLAALELARVVDKG